MSEEQKIIRVVLEPIEKVRQRFIIRVLVTSVGLLAITDLFVGYIK